MNVEKKEVKNITKLQLICIYDRKSGIYNGISAVQNNAVALRSFSDECHNPKSMLAIHPEDYELCNLGEMELGTGKIEPKNLPIVIGSASQFVQPKKEQN